MNPDELRELVERNFQIQETVKTDGWLYLYDEISRLIEAKKREILAGKLTLEEYKITCGFLDGVNYVLSAPERLNAKVKAEQR